MSQSSDRIRNLLRELSDISEMSNKNNTYNINIYDNSNFYNNMSRGNENNNLSESRPRTSGNGDLNNTQLPFENTNQSLNSDNSTDTPENNRNVTRVTAQVIPIRTDLFNNGTDNLSNEITEMIQNNLENILNGNLPTLPSLSSLNSTNNNANETPQDDKPLSLDILNRKTNIIIIGADKVDKEKCNICNEFYNLNDICRINNLCGHYFHQRCIDMWYSEKSICPECNQIIT
tara:strand:- start:751 stop:1446 length:696 start_codon:yes stop_codon:yes gene_type:complete